MDARNENILKGDDKDDDKKDFASKSNSPLRENAIFKPESANPSYTYAWDVHTSDPTAWQEYARNYTPGKK